jgi:hypothetical protein
VRQARVANRLLASAAVAPSFATRSVRARPKWNRSRSFSMRRSMGVVAVLFSVSPAHVEVLVAVSPVCQAVDGHGTRTPIGSSVVKSESPCGGAD